MAIEYCCGSAANISAQDGRDLLMLELGLKTSEPTSLWLLNAGVTVMLRDYSTARPDDSEIQFAGFQVRWGMRMRPVLNATDEALELGCRTMIKVVDCLLRHTPEDLYFSKEWERMLIIRRNGIVSVRDNFSHYLSEAYLSKLSLPFSVHTMQP
jgi:hypothetical protein